MLQNKVNLNRLNVFVAAADAGGFTAAATRLGATKAMVSQQIARLEREMDVTLFQRTTRKVTLTEEGTRLYTECAPLMARLREAVDLVGAERAALAGPLRITVGVDHLHTGFAEVLTEFARLHPRLTLDVLASDAVVDLVGEGIDIAIRRGWLRDSSLRATTLGEFEQWVVASPDYLRRSGRITRPEHLVDHACIVFTALRSSLRRWSFEGPNGAKVTARIHGNLRCSSPIGVLSLARAGGGIASLAASSTFEDIARGTLVRLLPDWKLPKAGVFAVYPASRHVPPSTRALIDFLRARYVGTRT